MVRIYGASDDLVEIENSDFPENEIDCYDRDVRLHFTDGTVIRVGFGKPNIGGVWRIKIEHKGTAAQTLSVCEDENASLYSDVFEIDAEIRDVEIISKTEEDHRPSPQTNNCIGCSHLHPTNGNCTAVGGFCTAVPAAHCPLIPELRAEIAKLKEQAAAFKEENFV